MSLGNVLIRPQILNRRAINDEAQLVDLLTGLAARVLEDLLRGGAARPKIEAAMKACEATFVAALPQLQPAQTKLLALLKPYLDKIEAVKNPSSDLAGLQMIVATAYAACIVSIIVDHIEAPNTIRADTVKGSECVSCRRATWRRSREVFIVTNIRWFECTRTQRPGIG